MQPTLALGHGELVVGLGEVIHADEDVTRLGQAADRQRQDLQLGVGRRQVGFTDAPLRLEQRGQVRVVVDRQAVGVELE